MILTYLRDCLKKSCEYSCRRDSVFWRWQWFNISRVFTTREDNVRCPLLHELSAFDWATVSLECQTGQAYWRSGPGRITVQKQILKLAGECTKIRISRPKNGNIFWGGCSAPPRSLHSGRGTPLPHTLPHVLSTPAAALFLRSTCSLPALNTNPGSAPDSKHCTGFRHVA